MPRLHHAAGARIKAIRMHAILGVQVHLQSPEPKPKGDAKGLERCSHSRLRPFRDSKGTPKDLAWIEVKRKPRQALRQPLQSAEASAGCARVAFEMAGMPRDATQ